MVDSILKYGYVKGRVKFGFDCKEVDMVTAKVNNVPVGIYIERVQSGSPAEQSGVRADDIITAINGKPIKSTDALITERDKYKPGDTVKLTLYRRSTKSSLTLSVRLLEDRGAAPLRANAQPGW